MPSPPALIQALLDPRRYPHAAAPIDLVETHISWVLLTGEYAYKIKKPVDLGFLDFSTLEQRHHFCEEELRLNRRLAPSLYLGLVPITGTPDDPRLDGLGPAIEYALRMRQFDREQQLDRLLARGQLTAAHIDDLAATLADFHARTAVAGVDSPYGDPDHVWQPVAENFAQIAGRLGTEPPDRLVALRQWSEASFAQQRARIAARRRDGFVRECHGDAHLANMVLWDGRVVPFDCLEFNPSLRWIDVISEIAFTVMDLGDRGHPDLGWRLLNAWLEHSGDYAGVALLRFYLTYRAMVRAKVAIIRQHQAAPATAAFEAAREEYEGYLHHAERYTRPPPAALLITHGLSGAGKTTVSQQVIETLGAIRVRSDVERKRLHGLAATARSRSPIAGGLYGREAGDRTYERLAALAGELLDAGETVVVDAAFLERARRERFRALAQARHVPFLILDLVADQSRLRARIAQRIHTGGDASEAGTEVLTHQIATHEPLNRDETAATLTVDTAEPLSAAELTSRIRRRLAQRPGVEPGDVPRQ